MSTAARSKRKKPPACDYCKSHRVICHPQLHGPCPRCVEKGVNCKTTPVVRRKRRTVTKAETVQTVAKETSRDPSTSSSPTNSIGPTHYSSSTTVQSNGHLSTMVIIQPRVLLITDNSAEPSPVPPTLQLSTELVKELIHALRTAPYDSHPIITNPILPLSQLRTTLQLHSWHLHSLSPPERVLAHCLLTFSALHSVHPFIIGPGELCVEESRILTSSSPLKTPSMPDFRQFGFRREPVVRQLWAESLWLANQAAIATNTSKENAASCWILGYLCYAMLGNASSAFSAACVHHMRTLAEDGILSTEHGQMLKLRGHMIGDTLPALMVGRNIPITINDELLIVPRRPESLEDFIRTFTTKTCSPSDIFISIHTFAHNTIRLARQTVENLTGTYARSQPLDECFLIKHFASLDVFHSFLSAALQQISWNISQSHAMPERTYYLRACSYGYVVAWSSLVLVLFELLRDRSICDVPLNVNGDGIFSNGVTMAAGMSNDRLLMHLRHARKLASGAVVEMYETMRDVPSFMRLMSSGDLVRWSRFLLEQGNVVDLTREQCFQVLECFRDALKLVGFSYVDRTGMVDAINEHLASYIVDSIFTQLGPPSQDLRPVFEYSSTGSISDWFETGL
ncbi:hypothetical protein J3R30DRAFT_3481948 [Lentinula aciculospora]|uniref:Zn(2)-C6 fungal-type domain-containing protein n=1 Tax=Lentinula aciculospora TaxID=153920 RepID=A0A9W9ABW9_9AGAR|nr:hypothetical protein J3R30DRAFT_3481948 [Lentinula aciculospora]